MQRKLLNIGNAVIRFRNFSGREEKYNRAGKRNFTVFLDDGTAEELQQDGWNIKRLRPRDPEESPQAYLQVAVAFEHFPPDIYIVTKRARTRVLESGVSVLDWAEIENADLVIRPREWKDDDGVTRIKAYLKVGYFKIVEDAFADKYREIPVDDESQSPPWIEEK